MADPFGFIGNTLQSAFLPDTEDEEARKYREEYERMRRTLQAQGKPAPPPIYQTRKPKNILGGLLPEYGAGTLEQKRRGERDDWRKSYDPIAMKRFQDQRKRDEHLRDIKERQQLGQIGSKLGQTPSMTPSFTKAAQEGGWSPAELSVLAKRGDPTQRSRTPEEEGRYEQLYGMHAPDISNIEAAKQATMKTPAVQQQQQYLSNYWDAMNKGKVWSSAVEAQEAKNSFDTAYNEIKERFERATEDDKLLLSKVAGLYADLQRRSYEDKPQVHVDAITGKAIRAGVEGAEYASPGAVAHRATLRDAQLAAGQKSAVESRDFLDWFNTVDPSKYPGFLSAQEWERVEAMIRSYGMRSGTSNAKAARAALDAYINNRNRGRPTLDPYRRPINPQAGGVYNVDSGVSFD